MISGYHLLGGQIKEVMLKWTSKNLMNIFSTTGLKVMTFGEVGRQIKQMLTGGQWSSDSTCLVVFS